MKQHGSTCKQDLLDTWKDMVACANMIGLIHERIGLYAQTWFAWCKKGYGSALTQYVKQHGSTCKHDLWDLT